MKLNVGDKAPDFNLSDANGKTHKLSDFNGKKLLIYFYPKDNTPGCTKEACSLRDNLPDFSKLKTQVVGISGDSIDSHAKFSQKYNLNFLLLADTERKVLEKYDVWQKKSMYGRFFMGILRTSFLIDEKGKILKIYEKVKPDLHSLQVLSDLKSFN
jgi:peroxiredoxin Q/BCP